MFPIPTLKQIEELEDTCIYYSSQEAMKQWEKKRMTEIERLKKIYRKHHNIPEPIVTPKNLHEESLKKWILRDMGR